MLNGALLGILEEAGMTVLTLAEGIEEPELRASRLTRAEVRRQLQIMGQAAAGFPPDARQRMPELEWAGWDLVAKALRHEGPEADDATWFAVSSLVPATLMWLRVYRKDQPELFDFTA